MLIRFHRFEQLADVQMLAMMSCVFSKSWERTSRNEDELQKSTFSSEQLSRSSSYYPSLEVAVSLMGTSIQVSPRKTIGTNSTTNSSANASVSDQSGMFYENNNVVGRTALTPMSFHKGSQTASLSTSPEHQRRFYRSNSNLSAMAASLTRPFSLGNSAASSPPNNFPKKRVSPSGSYLGATPSSISWTSTSMFGRTSTVKEGSLTSNSFSVSDTEEKVASNAAHNMTQASDFATILKNQGDFHDEGHAYLDLLDPNDELRFVGFREAYSELLYVWKLPIARCELLKYNSPRWSEADQPHFDKTIPTIRGLPAESTSLTFGVHCTFCAFISHANPLNSRCRKCTRTVRALCCFYCNSYIHGLASPCLYCGHSLHHSCRQLVTKSGIKECVSGCGCICSDHHIVEISRPLNRQRPREKRDRTREISPAITIIPDAGVQEQATAAWKGSEWEEMAYESLSRNLRRERRGSEKVIKERVSQIWRGGGV